MTSATHTLEQINHRNTDFAHNVALQVIGTLSIFLFNSKIPAIFLKVL